jgi:hypothetical protein
MLGIPRILVLALLALPVSAEAVAQEAPAGKDCHGPMYYQLKAADRQQRENEAALSEVEAFVTGVGPRLEAVRRAEQERLSQQLAAPYVNCLKATRRPSIFCTTLAARDVSLCQEVPLVAQKETCLLVVPAAAAYDSGEPSHCDVMTEADNRAFCRFMATRQFDCAQMVSPFLAAACPVIKALAAGDTAASQPPADPVAASFLAWLVAIVGKDPAACAVIPFPAYRDGCRSLVLKDAAQCPPVRPMVEHVDRDYSCRNVLAYKAAHPTSDGGEMVVSLANPYNGVATCTVDVERVRAGKGEKESTPEVVTAGPVTLDGKGSWADLTVKLETADPVSVTPRCTWDPKTSRFDLKAEDANDW